MDNEKKAVLIKGAIEVVLLLFAAFGGFLTNIAPPGSDVKLPLGIAQFITLCLLLYISAFSRYSLSMNKRKYKKNYGLWLIVAGIFLVLTLASAFVYFGQYEKRVIAKENWDVRLVRGQLTDSSRAICAEEKIGDTNACEFELLNNFYTSNEVMNGKLWTRESVSAAKMRLLVSYIAFILSLSVILFAALELLLSKAPGKQDRPPAPSGTSFHSF
jgi:hypothetical protein